jgi:hypothetical protein
MGNGVSGKDPAFRTLMANPASDNHNDKKQEESTYYSCCSDMFCGCRATKLGEEAFRAANELYPLEKEEKCYRERKECLPHH